MLDRVAGQVRVARKNRARDHGGRWNRFRRVIPHGLRQLSAPMTTRPLGWSHFGEEVLGIGSELAERDREGDVEGVGPIREVVGVGDEQRTAEPC